MPARLLVVADPKMLPALATGLREGGRFDVVPLAIGDLPAVQAACAAADAVALFYGTAERPLTAALLQLAPALRERGARVIAVLQKDQAPQRDDCFRAGASDVLFMPLPKEQFVSRLADSVALAFSGEAGKGAEVSVSTRAATHRLEGSAVTAAGVLAPAGPEMKAGETVRLAWSGGGASFQAWGLVVRSDGRGVRLRFAGTAPEEEVRLRDWLRGAPVPPQPPPPSWAAAPTIAEAPKFSPPTVAEVRAMPAAATPPALAAVPAPAPAALLAAPEPAALPPSPSPAALPAPPSPAVLGGGYAATVATLPSFAEAPASGLAPSDSATTSSPGVPLVGPPPGFAQRPPIRPQSAKMISRSGAPLTSQPTGSAARISSTGLRSVAAAGNASTSGSPKTGLPTMPAALDGAAAAGAAARGVAPAPGPGVGAVEQQPLPAGPPVAEPVVAQGLSALFDEVGSGPAGGSASPGPDAAGVAPAPATGPSWPTALDPALIKGWLTVMLKERNLPSEVGPEVSAAFVKVAGGLSSGEREALEKAGLESHLHEALLARVALALAGASGYKLFHAQPPAVIDAAQVAVLTQQGDAAGKRLQGEADKAITKGEVEALQLVTAASAALSREQLSFKETVDRLKGLAAAPRLGAGALDPDLAVPGQAPRAARTGPQEKEKERERRTELKDFVGLEGGAAPQSRKRMLLIGAVVLAVSVANGLWWSHPGAKSAAAALVENAGVGVIDILIADRVAMVRVTKAWATSETRRENLKKVCAALETKGVKKAILQAEGMGVIGHVEIGNCKPVGLPAVRPPVDPNAPPLPK